jgi:hypothetical protein
MVWLAMLVIRRRWFPAELALQLQWCDPARTFWLELGPAYSLTSRPHRVLWTASARRTGWTMTRPRGRPRRGSPWKPRRPSVSPSDSPSISSSPRLQSGHFSASSHGLTNPQFNCMAMVPRTPSSPQRHLLSPPVNPSVPTPALDPLGYMGGDEHPHHASRGAGPHPHDSFTAAQIRDSLAALNDLVFGIRQGVEDLNYRLQETDAKVELFLRTLSSLQDSLASSPAEAVPMEEPGAATGAGKDVARESKADDTAGDVEDGKIWADQPTYVEEEPWPGDLQAKWPDFSPGV